MIETVSSASRVCLRQRRRHTTQQTQTLQQKHSAAPTLAATMRAMSSRRSGLCTPSESATYAESLSSYAFVFESKSATFDFTRDSRLGGAGGGRGWKAQLQSANAGSDGSHRIRQRAKPASRS